MPLELIFERHLLCFCNIDYKFYKEYNKIVKIDFYSGDLYGRYFYKS